VACTAGFNSASCQTFFANEPSVNAKCASCLAPFEYSLTEGTGIFNCVSPFVTGSCNHDTGCVTDCEQKSCDGCKPSAEPACLAKVEAGQCAPYLSAASCAFGGFFGMGAFCNPFMYFNNYGSWLAAVGAHYCE
jgi:hypothetical protein